MGVWLQGQMNVQCHQHIVEFISKLYSMRKEPTVNKKEAMHHNRIITVLQCRTMCTHGITCNAQDALLSACYVIVSLAMLLHAITLSAVAVVAAGAGANAE